MAMALTDVIRQRIGDLSDRGVFRGWSEEAGGRSAKTTFRFRWLLDNEFVLIVDPTKQELTAKNLLPSIENRSFIDSDLRRFIAARTDAKLPAHRRLISDFVRLTYTNRKQNVSLVMKSEADQHEYAIKALLGTLNDLFAYLHLNHIDYLHRHFGVPEE